MEGQQEEEQQEEEEEKNKGKNRVWGDEYEKRDIFNEEEDIADNSEEWWAFFMSREYFLIRKRILFLRIFCEGNQIVTRSVRLKQETWIQLLQQI